MNAPMPMYEALRRDGTQACEAEGYQAMIAAVRYLYESGEEAGELTTHYLGEERVLEHASYNGHSVVWRTTQGLRAGLR